MKNTEVAQRRARGAEEAHRLGEKTGLHVHGDLLLGGDVGGAPFEVGSLGVFLDGVNLSGVAPSVVEHSAVDHILVSVLGVINADGVATVRLSVDPPYVDLKGAPNPELFKPGFAIMLCHKRKIFTVNALSTVGDGLRRCRPILPTVSGGAVGAVHVSAVLKAGLNPLEERCVFCLVGEPGGVVW